MKSRHDYWFVIVVVLFFVSLGTTSWLNVRYHQAENRLQTTQNNATFVFARGKHTVVPGVKETQTANNWFAAALISDSLTFVLAIFVLNAVLQNRRERLALEIERNQAR